MLALDPMGDLLTNPRARAGFRTLWQCHSFGSLFFFLNGSVASSWVALAAFAANRPQTAPREEVPVQREQRSL